MLDQTNTGFTITPLAISYTANPINWAIFARLLRKIDPTEQLTDAERTLLETRLHGIEAAVQATLGLAWMDDKQRADTREDVEAYLSEEGKNNAN